MVVLCDVQHRRLSFRSVTRLSLVCSWSPPSTHQGSRVRQGYGIREAFWEPCSVARRAASATISDFRIRDLGCCDALSLHCVCAVFRHMAGVPICFTSLFRVCVWLAIRGEGLSFVLRGGLVSRIGMSRGACSCLLLRRGEHMVQLRNTGFEKLLEVLGFLS